MTRASAFQSRIPDTSSIGPITIQDYERADIILAGGLGSGWMPPVSEMIRQGAIILMHEMGGVGIARGINAAEDARFNGIPGLNRWFSSRRVAEISRAVTPATQGKGVGTELLYALREASLSVGYDTVISVAWRQPDGHVNAARSLEKLGFTFIGRTGAIYRGECEKGTFDCPSKSGGCRCSAEVWGYTKDDAIRSVAARELEEMLY